MIATELLRGELVVLPTDTLYGIHATALNPHVVEKLYQIKNRKPDKPFIILISSLKQLNLFGIKLNTQLKKILNMYWPGKVSVVLPCPSKKFEYLHRGTKSLAFRMPDKKELLKLIDVTGPLISTSVNPKGHPPAKNIIEAKKYFGDQIKYYVDQGILDAPPSTLISIENGKITVLRQGEVIIRNE